MAIIYYIYHPPDFQPTMKKQAKIEVIVVDKIDHPADKLASVQWQFINNSLTRTDIDQLGKLGIEIYEETECIDERAAPQTIFTGKVRLERNCPGGGFDFFSPKDIRNILRESGNLIILDPHRSCGWGSLRLNYYLNYDKEITAPLKGSTMIIKRDQKFRNGTHYVYSLVSDAFSDNNYLNAVLKSAKLQRLYSNHKDLQSLLNKVFPGQDTFRKPDSEQNELIELAFAFGKLKELKLSFEREAQLDDNHDVRIKLNPDLLFDQPGLHIAGDAVINLTPRLLVRRFPIRGAFPDSFFADINMEQVQEILILISAIMEGHHSATTKSEHEFHVVCNQSQLESLSLQLDNFKNSGTKIVTSKRIFIHVIDNAETPKSDAELLDLVI
jgi:hypothetical protein